MIECVESWAEKSGYRNTSEAVAHFGLILSTRSSQSVVRGSPVPTGSVDTFL